MLLFGGMFQCYPVRNPQDPAATTLPVEQLAAETALLCSQALSLWHSTQRSSVTFEQLVAQLRTWSEQTLRAVGSQLAEANGRILALQQAVAELEQVTALRRNLEDHHRELQTQRATSLRAVDDIRARTGQMEKSVADLRQEEESLRAELDEARQKSRSVKSLRAEIAELKTKVEQGGQERDELLQQAHSLRVKLSDTQALIEEARRQAPTAVAESIEQIWRDIPADAFDQLMGNKC
jgi:chromosome segregation ATPase